MLLGILCFGIKFIRATNQQTQKGCARSPIAAGRIFDIAPSEHPSNFVCRQFSRKYSSRWCIAIVEILVSCDSLPLLQSTQGEHDSRFQSLCIPPVRLWHVTSQSVDRSESSAASPATTATMHCQVSLIDIMLLNIQSSSIMVMLLFRRSMPRNPLVHSTVDEVMTMDRLAPKSAPVIPSRHQQFQSRFPFQSTALQVKLNCFLGVSGVADRLCDPKWRCRMRTTYSTSSSFTPNNKQQLNSMRLLLQ
jgi:hypothetical protein